MRLAAVKLQDNLSIAASSTARFSNAAYDPLTSADMVDLKFLRFCGTQAKCRFNPKLFRFKGKS
jgi:hypothetical protein